MAKSIKQIAVEDLKGTDGVRFRLPDQHSAQLGKVLMDTSVVPILRWSEEAEIRGCLGRLCQLRDAVKAQQSSS